MIRDNGIQWDIVFSISNKLQILLLEIYIKKTQQVATLITTFFINLLNISS
jgi:hypothetical protein